MQQPSKFFALLWIVLALGNDADEVFSQHKRNSFPVDAELFLPVIEKVAKVNVKYLQH